MSTDTTATPPGTADERDRDAQRLDVLNALRTDTGRRWGETATDWQRADAAAVLLGTAPDDPRLHFITRPRGGSKTTDLACIAVMVLATQAPPQSRSLAYAADQDQAGLLLDAMRTVILRSGLSGVFDVRAWQVINKRSGARLTVESADGASAFGQIPFLVIADEVAAWAETRNTRILWEAIVSSLPKRPDSRLAVISSAGQPGHWSHRVIEAARTSPRWRVSETPGPLPWIDPADLDEQRRLLSDSAFRRLHLNQWVSSEDRLVSHEDLRACVTLDGPQPPRPGVRYLIGCDLGLKNDRTVIAVCHAETAPATTGGPSGAPLIVLDRLHVLQGSRAQPVRLDSVEALLADAATAYNHAKIRLDPWQGVGLAQRLRGGGIAVEEFTFSATSVGRLASTLHLALRDHRVALPDEPDLLRELSLVRLRENSAGVVRLDHDSGEHDDQAMALALAAFALTERPAAGGGHISVPRGRRVARQGSGAARRLVAAGGGVPVTGTAQAMRGRRMAALLAARQQTRRGRTTPTGGVVGVSGAASTAGTRPWER